MFTPFLPLSSCLRYDLLPYRGKPALPDMFLSQVEVFWFDFVIHLGYSTTDTIYS